MSISAIDIKKLLYGLSALVLALAFLIPVISMTTVSAQADENSADVAENDADPSDLPDDAPEVEDARTPAEIEQTPVAPITPAPKPAELPKLNTGGIPKTFKAKADCEAKVGGAKSVKIAKNYAKERAVKRLDALNKYQNNLNNQKKKLKNDYKKTVKKYTINPDVRVPYRISSGNIQAEIIDARKQIKQLKSEAYRSNDKKVIAQKACAMVHDVRVFTYLDSKIKNQNTINSHYRANGLLRAQYTSLKANAAKSPEANAKAASLRNPDNTLNSVIKPMTPAINSITAAEVNRIQTEQPKKKASAIFTERLKPQYQKAKSETAQDTKSANELKAVIKKSTATSSTTITNNSKPTSQKPKTVKKVLKQAQINEVCKAANEPRLQDAKEAKGKAELNKACNTGIKGGFSKKEANARVFCSDGGGTWTIGKSPKKVEACVYGYEKGLALR